jgi:calnexin
MVDSVVFDNFLITSDQSIAKQYADQIWYPKSILEGKAISAASESVIDAIVNATKDRPWLWAVYLVAILLPLIILIVFCWTRKSSKKSPDSIRKKTEESSPDSNEQQELADKKDDDDDNDEDVEEIDIPQVKPTTARVTRATSKDALEKDQEDVDDNVNVRNNISIELKNKAWKYLSLDTRRCSKSKFFSIRYQQSSSSCSQRIIRIIISD